MAKTHYYTIPCNSKSWSDGMQDATFFVKDEDDNFVEKSFSETGMVPAALPTTNKWKNVTCKKCLRKRPDG